MQKVAHYSLSSNTYVTQHCESHSVSNLLQMQRKQHPRVNRSSEKRNVITSLATDA